MKVRRDGTAGEPKYPSRTQLADYKRVLGVAAIGLGAVAAWGEPQRTAGVPVRTGGKIVSEPKDAGTGANVKQPGQPPRLGGDIAVVPLPGAPPVEPRPGTTNVQMSARYIVKSGDTLYSIAAQQLGDKQRWREILAANPGIKANDLKVGQVVVIPPHGTGK
jgi:nucleoid-associated protein YgaU